MGIRGYNSGSEAGNHDTLPCVDSHKGCQMPRLAFSTFIKLGMLTSPELSSELEKYNTPKSGYDFYRKLRRGAKSFAGHGAPYEDAVAPILDGPDSPEKTHNLAAMETLKNWVSKKKPTLFAPPSHKIFQAPLKRFEVRVEPEFAMELEDTLWIVQVFVSSKHKLTPTSAEPGLHLLRRKYQGTEFANASPGILDLSQGKILGKKWNTNRAAKVFDHLVNDINNRFEN